MRGNFAKILEDCRSASIDVTADVIEGIYRARKGSECDPCAPTGRGDFLYDMISLNVGYWTQMARLGSAYSIYAHRFLAAMYGAYLAPTTCGPQSAAAPCEPTCRLHFEGLAGDKMTRILQLTNPDKTARKPDFTLDPAQLDGKALSVQFKRGGNDARAQDVLPGEVARIAVTVDIPDLPPGRYESRLTVKLDKCEQEFRLSICVVAT